MKAKEVGQKVREKYLDANGECSVLSKDLWEFCIGCIENPVTMNKIIADNDYGIPPVSTLMTIYKDKNHITEEFELGTDTEHQKLGKIMKYVLQDILGYEYQAGEHEVNIMDVKTAMLYANGKHVFVD